MSVDPNIAPRWRLLAVALLMVSALFFLGMRLYRIQVRQSSRFSGEQRRQSIRRVLLPAPRGRIFDRNGLCLADNRPNYCIAIYLEELRRPGDWTNTINAVDHEVERVAAALGVARQIDYQEIAQHVRKRLPLPLLAWQGLDMATLARFSEQVVDSAPGFEVYVQAERSYPAGSTAAHLLGYVGRDRPVMTNEVFHYDIMGMRGRAGLEQSFDTQLAGVPGGELITVTVTGYKHSTTRRAPVAGQDLTLTLHTPLQQLLEQLLRGRRAAGVILDPRNGDVLALASMPEFNLNAMTPSISHRDWQALQRNRDLPLLNRAISGTYPPGSIFKPLVGLAGLRHGFSIDTPVVCNGVFELGAMRLRCWHRGGHGAITLCKALEQSCNPYFCTLGVQIGLEPIREMALELGLGNRTGIELAGEAQGLVPSDAWKRRVQGDAWRAGDTANISIGQGQLLVTPLQMAVYTAALANRGRVLRPRLVADPQQPEGDEIRHLNLTHELAAVRRGMYDVVQAERGTGKRAAVPGVNIAGKTGTAEYGSAANRRKHTWMIAFAPYEEPEVAMAILVEDGESGGLTVAPIVRQLIQQLFAPDATPAQEDGVVVAEDYAA